MFHDNLLYTHLNITMYKGKTINIVQSIRVIWYRILISWRSWTNATRCSRYLRYAGITNVTTLVMVVIVISTARATDSTGRAALDPWRYDVRWWIFLRFAAWKKKKETCVVLFDPNSNYRLYFYILNFGLKLGIKKICVTVNLFVI